MRSLSAWLLAVGLAVAPGRGWGQTTLLPSTSWSAGATVGAWHLATPLAQSTGAVADVAEVAVPFRVRTVRRGFSFDLSGAVAFGAVHVTTTDDDRLLTIAGPTDVKVRVTAPLGVEATMITVGVNLPSGKARLSADETSALQVLAAPALQMPIGAFGNGGGATLGLVHGFQGETWALGLGASVERRAEYSAVALALSSGTSETTISPGSAAHVTAGLDRTVGPGRFSMLVVGDVYSKDRVRIGGAPVADSSGDYTLGPQVTVTGQLDFGGGHWRERTVSLGSRVRTPYADAKGTRVPGSSGTYLEGALSAVRGGPEGAGLVLGTDARWHSGLAFTTALVGAAVSAVGMTIGLDHAGESASTRIIVHGTYGSFDTGAVRTTGLTVTWGISIGARRDAQ